MSLYLVRHGETDWNKKMLLQGREDIPLNEEGIRQAHECGKAFREHGMVKKARIVSSPLLRAKKTAEIIATYIGVEQIEIEENLIEREFGLLSGQHYEKAGSYRDTNGEDGMESMAALFRRMEQVVMDYKTEEPIIFVSHGASINAALGVFSKGVLGPGKTWLKNACISAIDFMESETKVSFHNLSPDEFLQHK